MESPPGSPLLEDEEVVPCKGCGNILEEGKAFELAGNRWHIDCFRCNSCDTLLDSDANLLMLGDGTLICNNCTYSCTACGNKIEDLAILTGDQAFCAGCFRCRNCKRKIENLKYARTSQGIFCMSCHETLMTRRKKRPKQNQNQRVNNAVSPMLALDKSLPSLPVDDDMGSSSLSTTPTESVPRLRPPPASRTNSAKSNTVPDQLSPMAFQPSTDHLRAIPRSHKRHSQITFDASQILQDYSFVPIALDTPPINPAPATLPGTVYNRSSVDPGLHSGRPSYDRKPSSNSSQYDSERERGTRPHIATQDKSYELQISIDRSEIPRISHEPEERLPSTRLETRVEPRLETRLENRVELSQFKKDLLAANSRSQETSDMNAKKKADGDLSSASFKLGEVPRERRKPVGTPQSFEYEELYEKSRSLSPCNARVEPPQKISADSIPPRGDSFRPPISRTESPVSMVSARVKAFDSPSPSAPSPGRSNHSQTASSSSGTAVEIPESAASSNRDIYGHKKNDSAPVTVPRPSPPRRLSTTQDLSSFSPVQSEHSEMSPSLPPFNKSSMAGLGFDEEIKRVFGSGPNESILRRVSNSAAKHTRSLSEAARQSPKWPKSPASGAYTQSFGEITAPMSPDGREDVTSLKQELRRSTQRIAELEAKLNNNASARALEHNIQEKRNTVALLETEREAFLRELMVIKERLDASKEGKQINFEELKSDLIHELTRQLEDLKETLRAEIQGLVAQRDHLMEDVENFGRLREQAIQETEQLNLKNAQLADLNNELTRRIQGQFKANKVPGGLGIFDGSHPDLMDLKDFDKRPTPSVSSATPSMSTIGVPYSETAETTDIFVAQKVAPFKNGAQQKKFFWKKPGATIMKGANKVGRVFAVDQDGNGVDSPHFKSQGTQGTTDAQSGKLGKKRGKTSKGTANTHGGGGSIPAQENGGHVAIFGGELELRTQLEGVKIPVIVQKCIQEVQMRGMDYEGIYRKSGGSTQMRQIQDEFERGDDVQFSPDLDICSVTSVLKQYFRNLPNPLITYELYDRFVDTSNIQDQEARIEALKAIMDDLPPSHHDVLQFTIFHLARVAARKEENLMNTRNLAVVFAPTLLRHLSDEREMSDMHAKNNAIQFLIDHNEDIFP